MAQDTITMLAPDGTARAVPMAQRDAALKSGGREVVKILDPTGTARWAPKDELGKYLAAGAKVAPSLVPPSREGVKVIGKNAKGQDILAPEGQSFMGELGKELSDPKSYTDFAKGAWNEAKSVPSGIASMFKPPETTDRQAAMLLGPIGLPLKRMVQGEANSRMAVGRQAYDQFKRGETTRGVVSSLSAAMPLPAVPGMVAGINQKEDEGKGAEAFGQGTVDAALLAGLPEKAAKVAKNVGRSTLETVTGTSPRVVRELVNKRLEAAAPHLEATQESLGRAKAAELKWKADLQDAHKAAVDAQKELDDQHVVDIHKAIEDTRQKEDVYQAELRKAKAESEEAYQKKLEEVQGKRQKAEQDRKDELEKYQAKKAEIEAKHDAAQQKYERDVAAQASIVPTTNAYHEAYRDAHSLVEYNREKALKIGNEKYNTVNEALNPIPAQPQFYEYVASKAGDEVAGSKGAPTYLKAINQRVKSGTPIRYEDLQSDYSNLGRELSKGNLSGDVYHAYDVMHEAIGEEMQRIADSQQMGAHLTDARNYWRRMKQAFGRPLTDNNVASGVLRDVAPDAAKAAARANQIRMLGSFDDRIPGEFENLAKAQAAVDALPKPASADELAGKLKAGKSKPVPAEPQAPPPIPNPPPIAPKDVAPVKPTELPDRPKAAKMKLPSAPEDVEYPNRPARINTADVEGAKAKGMSEMAAKLHRRIMWAAVTPTLILIEQLVRLHGVSPGEVGAAGVGTAGMIGVANLSTKLFENPAFVKFMTKATERDVAEIPPDLKGSLPAIIKAAKAKGIKPSPAILALSVDRQKEKGTVAEHRKKLADMVQASAQ